MALNQLWQPSFWSKRPLKGLKIKILVPSSGINTNLSQKLHLTTNLGSYTYIYDFCRRLKCQKGFEVEILNYFFSKKARSKFFVHIFLKPQDHTLLQGICQFSGTKNVFCQLFGFVNPRRFTNW